MARASLTTGALIMAIGCLLLGIATAKTQPQQPLPPDKFKVAVRYRILAPRDAHVAQYKALIGHLQSIAFQFDPKLQPFPNTDYEDPYKNILTGFLAPGQELRCLENSSVESLLVMPANYQLPADPIQPVRVRLQLGGGLPEARQLVLANQVRALLDPLGFKESIGFDHRGYHGKSHTRLVGTVPAEHVATLLKDLRTQPAGWLAPAIDPATLPLPVRQFTPIVVTEVLPDPGPAEEAPKMERRGQPHLDKIEPELWKMVISKDDDSRIVRAEIILSFVPAVGDESYRAALAREAPSLLIEGRLGPVVTAQLRVNQASGLASLPEVSVVRLARSATAAVDGPLNIPGDNARALRQSGLADLHQRGFRGKGVRIGIIDSDFRGYEELVKNGILPRTTRLVDLTIQFNADLYPDPQLGDDKTIGHGTQAALAAALAAPESDFTLIRIDPASLPQLQLAGKLVQGEPARDDLLDRRFQELRLASQEMVGRRDELISERQTILSSFADDFEFKRQFDILGPVVRGWLFTPREWHFLRMAEFEADRERLRNLEMRFHRFHEDLKSLADLHIVSTSLVWNDGYPLGGASALSRWFDEGQNQKALWFVSAGNTNGQTWAGAFRDADRNGVMEFAPPAPKLPTGSWTPELNFLAWRGFEQAPVLELPLGANIRITAQWREPHDPSYYWSPAADDYLKPLADVSLVVLRQRDPDGKAVPADTFEVAARSAVSAFRLENRPNGSTYEQVVEFTVTKSGRFALRVERKPAARWQIGEHEATGKLSLVDLTGLTAMGIRPLGAPALRALEPAWELQPRIFVQPLDEATKRSGRVVFGTFSTNDGSIPILADTRALIAVGACNWNGLPLESTAVGSPDNLWGFVRPNILTYSNLNPPGKGSANGASLATPFAAGMAATLLSAGQRQQDLREQLQKMNGVVWRIGPAR